MLLELHSPTRFRSRPTVVGKRVCDARFDGLSFDEGKVKSSECEFKGANVAVRPDGSWEAALVGRRAVRVIARINR